MANRFGDEQAQSGTANRFGDAVVAQPVPTTEPGYKPGKTFFEQIGGSTLMDLMAGASRTKEGAERTKAAFKGLVEGIKNEPKRVWSELSEAGKSMLNLDAPGTAYHLGGALPFGGAPAQQVAVDVDQGRYGEAAERAAALLVPAAPKVIKAAAPALESAAALASRAGTVAKGAAVGAAKATPIVGPMVRGAMRGAARAIAETEPARAPVVVMPPPVAPLLGPVRPPISRRAPVTASTAEIPRQNQPIRPPIIEPPPIPPETAPVPPASAPRAPLQPPLATPPVEPAPVPAVEPTAVPAAPPRTLRQLEVGMARTAPAPLEEPRSLYTATGERKSPLLRAAEITGSNTTAKAQRWAKALHETGITPEMVTQIEKGAVSSSQVARGMAPRWENVTDALVERGLLPAGEKPPNTSIPAIVKEVKKLQSARIAAELQAEMQRSGTVAESLGAEGSATAADLMVKKPRKKKP